MPGQLRRRLVARVPEPALRVLQRLRHWRAFEPRDALVEGGRHAQVVSDFDAHQVREDNRDAVRAALDRHGVPYVLVPGPRDTVRQVAVAAEDRAAALSALHATLTEPGWVIETRSGATSAHALRRGPAVWVHRPLIAPSGRPLGGRELGCELGFWRRVDHDGGQRRPAAAHPAGTRLAPTRNGVAAQLSPQSWDRAVRSSTHWPAPTRLIFEVREPVDIVYTWVDGEDPVWAARKVAFSAEGGTRALHRTAVDPSRFTPRDELRYSLRSVGMYANWVRRIFVVTDDQVPTWLDTANPKITMVDHKQIFSDPDALPVFNSHAIESQLHHIAGLSEHYLYLNDDVFFGRSVEPESFFHGNGIAKFFLSRDTLDLDPPSPQDLPAISAAKQNRALLETEFGVTVVRKFKHGVQPQLRSVLEEMERRHPDVFARVSHSRLRHPDDLSIASSLHHYYAYALGRAVPAEIDYRYQDISLPSTARRLDAILRTRPQVFCLNEIEVGPEQLTQRLAVLAEFLAAYFPVKSGFER